MTKHQRTVVYAHMGRTDLIPAHYFQTPRGSGLPFDYFHHKERRYWQVMAVLAVALLVACTRL